MKALLLLVWLGFNGSPTPAPLSTCKGETPCKACKNCTQCKYCNSGKGSCSVYREEEDRKAARKKGSAYR